MDTRHSHARPALPGLSDTATPREPDDRLLLRPVTPFDRDAVRRWLQDADVQRWWGNAASAEAEIRSALESAASLCRIMMLHGLAIGYAQAAESAVLDAASIAGVPPGSWRASLFIGALEHRGRGHGQRALDLLTREVFATTLAVAVCILVSVRNERAARAYENIGFRWTSIFDDPLVGPSWVMLRERPRR